MPVGLPQLGPISGIVSPTCFETYFLRRCATSRPSGSVESHSSRCIQPPYLASASVASRIAVTARSEASTRRTGSASGPGSRTVW